MKNWQLIGRRIPMFTIRPVRTRYGGRGVTWWHWLWFTWSLQRKLGR